MIKPVSYKRHRVPPEIIAHAVWLYFRFPLSLRLIEEMLLERGIVVSYETVCRWDLKDVVMSQDRIASRLVRLPSMKIRSGRPCHFSVTVRFVD